VLPLIWHWTQQTLQSGDDDKGSSDPWGCSGCKRERVCLSASGAYGSVASDAFYIVAERPDCKSVPCPMVSGRKGAAKATAHGGLTRVSSPFAPCLAGEAVLTSESTRQFRGTGGGARIAQTTGIVRPTRLWSRPARRFSTPPGSRRQHQAPVRTHIGKADFGAAKAASA